MGFDVGYVGALLAGHRRTAELLLELGADPNAASRADRSPMHLAIRAQDLPLLGRLVRRFGIRAVAAGSLSNLMSATLAGLFLAI